ncbi:TPA: DUF7352 domain-containing protein [Serratia fonticola]
MNMNPVVRKYVLSPAGYYSEILMPEDYKVLSVGAHGDDICLWVQISPNSPIILTPCVFVVVPTGEEIPKGFKDFIGTVVIDDMAFHVFE